VFASLRCSVDRASPSVTHEVSSNAVRVAGRLTGTGGSNPFSSTGDAYKPAHNDRVPADEQLGKPGNVGGSAETQMTITRREILRRALPAPPSSLPSGGSPWRYLVTSTNTGFAMHDDEGRQIGW
jgi:hypothetical protein